MLFMNAKTNVMLKQLRKQQTKIKKSKQLTKALKDQIPDEYFENPDAFNIADLDRSLEPMDPGMAYMQASVGQGKGVRDLALAATTIYSSLCQAIQ